MPDIIDLIKKQGEKRVADIHELTGKLSEQLKHLISLIPEETRNKNLETFLNDIRKGVLGEGAPRRGPKRGRRPSAASRTKKTKAAPGARPAAKRGRKKKEAKPEETAEKTA